MVKLIILGREPGLISSLKSHLPAAVFLFWLPQGDAAKKEKKLQQPAIVITIAKPSSEKFLYHFSELSKFATFVRIFGQNFWTLYAELDKY